MKISQSVFWASGVALGVCIGLAGWTVYFAFGSDLTTLLRCADAASRPAWRWACTRNVYLLRLTRSEVETLNSTAGAYLAAQLKDRDQADKMLAYFVSRGVNVDSLDAKGHEPGLSALHKAVLANQPQAVALLIAHGAKSTVLSNGNQMPLELARDLQQQRPQEDRGEVIKVLVQSGRPRYPGFIRSFN
jgi:hypothetical protein